MVNERPADPDTIYVNGRVHAVDAKNSIFEAVGVKDGRILATGSTGEIQSLANGRARCIDLGGRAMIPGFIDPHGHFPDSGLVALYRADLLGPPMGSCATIKEALDRLAAKAARTPKGEWVIGALFDQSAIPEGRWPTREELDRVSRDHPVWVLHLSGHAGAANSRALALRGVDEASPDPVGGHLARDAAGRLNGLLEGMGAMGPLGETDLAIDDERFLAAYRAAEAEYFEHGVTLAQNAWAGETLLRRFSLADRDPAMRMDVTALIPVEIEPDLASGRLDIPSPTNGRVRWGPRKLFTDGAIAVYTAYLSTPYHRQRPGETGHRGYPAMSIEAIRASVATNHVAGHQLHIHANGDAAIDLALDAMAAALKTHPRADHRHTLIHAQCMRDDQIERAAALGITISFFPAHIYVWGDRHHDIFLGPERAARISPGRSAIRSGARFTIHNDATVTPTRSLHLMWCAVERVTSSGRVLGADQRLTPREALRAHTIDAAWQVFREAERGSIEAGKRADFAILSDDPIQGTTSLKDIRVEETIVAGATVHRADQPKGAAPC